MPGKVSYVPTGGMDVTPYLTVRNGAKAIDFYKQVFGATVLFQMADPSGRIGHAELEIGKGRIMLADEFPEMGAKSPETIGGTPVMIHLYTPDVDSVVNQATRAGATVERPVEDQFYGDRAGQIRDPFGHIWWVSTHQEDVSEEEINRRAKAKFGQQSAQTKEKGTPARV